MNEREKSVRRKFTPEFREQAVRQCKLFSVNVERLLLGFGSQGGGGLNWLIVV